jgi:hypothetical protein
MKQSLLYTGLALVLLSSCSTAYKAGQTPDDVYFSPAREADEYVVVNNRNQRYDGYDEDRYYSDRYLRMRVMNRNRWCALDYYYDNPYAFSPYMYYHSWNNPWNSYWAWNNFYNPYFNPHFGWGGGGVWGGWSPGIIVSNPKITTRPSRALVFNPASYAPNSNSTLVRNGNLRYSNPGVSNVGRYNNSNNNNGLGSSLRKVFNGGNNNNGYQPGRNNSTNTPTRTYNPSSSSGGSSGRSSGGSSSGGVSRPIR